MHGLPLRVSARVVGSTTGQTSRSTLFIAGNQIEVVPPGRTEGVRHTLTRIFDVHASDSDVYEAEVLPLAGSVAAGLNAAVVIAGHHRNGRSGLFEAVSERGVSALFAVLDQQQAAAREWGGSAGPYTVKMAYASALTGTDLFADLLSPGSAEVSLVRDADAVGGVCWSGISTHTI